MTEKEMLDQVESLIDDRNSFIEPLDNDENNIFRKDKKALIWITKKYKEQQKELEQKDKEISEERIKYISSNLNNTIKQRQKEDEQLNALNEGWKIELEKKDKEISELKEKLER